MSNLSEFEINEIEKEIEERKEKEKSFLKMKSVLTQELVNLFVPEHENIGFSTNECSDSKTLNGIAKMLRDEDSTPDCTRCALIEVLQGKVLLSDVVNDDTKLKLVFE